MIEREVRPAASAAEQPAAEQPAGKLTAGAGWITYRGYPVVELCRRRSYEEVAYLLWHGELPTREQLTAQNRAERAQRALDPAVAGILAGLPPGTHPRDILRTAVSLLGASDPAGGDDSAASVQARSLRLFAVLPAVIALDQRRRHGLGAVPPRDDLGYAASFLYLTFGKVPEPQVVTAFETLLILCADRGPHASASAARAVASARSGLCGAVAAAIGGLNGSLHGDAGEAVMDMMTEIAIPDNVRPWLEQALAEGRTIAGFGASTGGTGDSRVAAMRTALGMVAGLRDGQHLLGIYEELAAVTHEVAGLSPDLTCPAALACHLIGFDTPMFTPVLAAACLPGWTAHIAGQLAAGNPIRPLTAGNGPAERQLR